MLRFLFTEEEEEEKEEEEEEKTPQSNMELLSPLNTNAARAADVLCTVQF